MRRFVCKHAGGSFTDIEAEDMTAAALAYVVLAGIQPEPRALGRPLIWVHESGGSPSIGSFWMEWIAGEWTARSTWPE